MAKRDMELPIGNCREYGEYSHWGEGVKSDVKSLVPKQELQQYFDYNNVAWIGSVFWKRNTPSRKEGVEGAASI